MNRTVSVLERPFRSHMLCYPKHDTVGMQLDVANGSCHLRPNSLHDRMLTWISASIAPVLMLLNLTLFESNVLLVETLSNPDHFDSSLSGKSPLKGPLMVPYSAVTILI